MLKCLFLYRESVLFLLVNCIDYTYQLMSYTMMKWRI